MLVIVAIVILIFYIVLGVVKPAIAMVTFPFVCGMLAVAGLLEQSVAPVALAPVIGLVTVVAVLFSKRSPESERWPRIVSKCTLITLLIIGFIILCFAAGGPGVMGLIFLVMAAAGFISYHLSSRRARAAEVISTIGSSIRQNLPLAMALETASAGRDDKTSRILARIKKWLVQGYSLSESLRLGYPACPAHAVAMIDAAERINQLPQALASIEADMVSRADEARRIRPIHPAYPVMVLILIFFVLALMKYVVPNFSAVMQEMTGGGSLPPPTRVLLEATAFISQELGVLIATAIVFLLVVGLPVALRAKYRPRRPWNPYVVSRLADFVKWYLPIVHWFEKNYSLAATCAMLKLSLSAGATVNEGVANTINLDVNSRFRARLKKWLARIESGENISESARKSGVGTSIAWAFDERINQGNTAGILETLEYFYRTNYSYRVNLARFILWPCVTVVLGLFVGFVVYAIMSPMISIISYLAGSIVP